MRNTLNDMRKAPFGAVSREELLRWTMDLIAIPSYSGLPRQEEAVAEYLVRLFESECIECRVDDLGEGRCNVVATLQGCGDGDTLMFNGHMDTVPAYGMEGAFNPRIEGDYLFGRGTSDMKGSLAAMAGALIALKRSGVALEGNLVYSAVADEEEASMGAIALLEKGIKADAVVVGEAMGRHAIGIAQKGLEWLEFVVHGKTVHGGKQEEGINAILKATRLIQALQDEIVPRLASRQHPLLGSPTLNIGVIRGGTQLSTVAGECIVQMDRRFIPGLETYESMMGELVDLIDSLEKEDPDFRCTFRVLESSIMKDGYAHQGMEQKEDDPLVQIVKRSLESVTGKPASLIGCPCWTDAGLFGHYGDVPVVIYGPGDLTKSHSEHECLELEALYESLDVFVEIAMNFCGVISK